MRKLFSVLLVLMLALVITACGDKDKDNNNSDNGDKNNTEQNDNNQNNNDGEKDNEDEQDKENDGNAENDGAANEDDADRDAAALEAFADFLIYLEAMDLDIGEAIAGDPAGAETINADYNIIVPVEGIDAQFFYFSDHESDEYKEGVEDHTISIDFEGESIPLEVFVSGDYGFLDYSYHHAGEQITEYMEDF